MSLNSRDEMLVRLWAGRGPIVLSTPKGVKEAMNKLKPIALHMLEDGTHDHQPSFCMVLDSVDPITVSGRAIFYSQFSLATLDACLRDLGLQITPVPTELPEP